MIAFTKKTKNLWPMFRKEFQHQQKSRKNKKIDLEFDFQIQTKSIHLRHLADPQGGGGLVMLLRSCPDLPGVTLSSVLLLLLLLLLLIKSIIKYRYEFNF